MRLDNSTILSLIVRKGGGEGWYRNGLLVPYQDTNAHGLLVQQRNRSKAVISFLVMVGGRGDATDFGISNIYRLKKSRQKGKKKC